jgi:hypothetical protein
MPKPPRADRPVEKTLSLPQSLVTKVDLILWSELEGKVPHGAWRDYVVGLVEKDLEHRAALQDTARKMMGFGK